MIYMRTATEREGERNRETDRQTDRKTDRQTRERDERDRDRDRETSDALLNILWPKALINSLCSTPKSAL